MRDKLRLIIEDNTTLEASKYIDRARKTVYQPHKKWECPTYNYGPQLLFKKTDLDI